ncbi:DUF2798 domain-containing protein [Paenibacillus tengchongensis]|uniref:DUF2798 domain-containing protein n=1 Tax=Paenibacillus tengchongensis TaxID=2608684 RepID=UPI00124DF473|nr:DUF2798 domain-containing protein [Paenibacillus tengchongensis]
MGRNKKEALIFTSIMCVFMVFGMSVYNVVIFSGLTRSLLGDVLSTLLPALAVALVCDIFIVGKLAKGAAGKWLKPDAPVIRKVLTISCLMVCGMVLCMSLYGTLAHYGLAGNFISHYLTTAGLNFICALPLQLLIVGPLTRFLFTKLFPPDPAISH